MTLARPAEATNIAQRLQEQKAYLIVLANRAPLIESEGMEPDVLAELNIQVAAILEVSERRLRKLIADIKDNMNEDEMQTLDNKINQALDQLTDDEARKMSQAYDNSMSALTYQKNLEQEKLETSKEEIPVQTDHPPIVASPTETPVQAEASTNTSHHWGTLFAQTTQAVVQATVNATQALTTPSTPPAPPAKSDLSAEALRLKAQFNKRTTLFAPEDKPQETLSISQDETAVENDAKPVVIKRTQRRVRRVQTEEFESTPKQKLSQAT